MILLILKVATYLLFLHIPLSLMIIGNQESYQLPEISSNWYQDFKENIVLTRNENFTERIEDIKINRNYFNFENTLVYYDKTGNINHQIKLSENNFFSPTEKHYVLYQKTGTKVRLFDKFGEKKWLLNTFSYPKLSPLENLFMLISTDNSTISFYDINKNLILSENYLGSLITDFKFSNFNDSLLLGTMNGKLFYYDYQGNLQFIKTLEKSKFNYIKTVAISSEGNYLLSINGLQPEYLTVFDKKGNLLWQKNTLIERRTLSYPNIDERNDLIYDLRNNKIHILNLKNGETQKIIDFSNKISEEIKYALIKNNQDYLGIVLNNDYRRVFFLLNKKYKVIWEKDFVDEFITYLEISEIKLNKFELLIHSEQSIYFYNVKLPN